MNRARRLIRTNAPGRKPHGRKFACALALTAAAGLLSGCISDPFNTPVDKAAPGAARINEVASSNLPYPRWSQFPAAPKDVPTVQSFAAKAQSLNADQTELLQEAAALQWTLSGTEAWAAEQRALIDPAQATPAPSDAEAQAEAWAAQQRQYATPPPAPR